MKVVHLYPHKEHLPVKYTQNIKFNFDFLGVKSGSRLTKKKPSPKWRGF
jgi:hypothetical protein